MTMILKKIVPRLKYTQRFYLPSPLLTKTSLIFFFLDLLYMIKIDRGPLSDSMIGGKTESMVRSHKLLPLNF